MIHILNGLGNGLVPSRHQAIAWTSDPLFAKFHKTFSPKQSDWLLFDNIPKWEFIFK